MSFVRSARLLALLCCFWLHATAPVQAGGNAAKRSGGYFVKIRAGGVKPVRLYIHENGRGQPMLLLHGFGASGYEWHKIAPKLARRYRVITLDLKGFGRSSKPRDNRYSITDQAALVKAFIRRRGLRRLILVGHSYGGSVALKVILDLNRADPGRISKLVLMNVPAYPQRATSFIDTLQKPGLAVAALRVLPTELIAKFGLYSGKLGLSHISGADISAYAVPLRSKGAIDAMITAARQIVPRNLRALIARYPSIHQRTLLITCKDDPTVPVSSSVRLNAVLPNSRLRIIKRCEHAPPEESPRAALRLMNHFLRQG